MPLGLDVHRKRWADVADEMSDEDTSEEEGEEDEQGQENTDSSRRSWSVSATTKTSPKGANDSPKGANETLAPERVPEPYDSSFDEFLTTWVPPPAKPKTRTKIKIKKDGTSTVVHSQTRNQDVSVAVERYESYELYNQSRLKTKQTAVSLAAVSSEAVKS